MVEDERRLASAVRRGLTAEGFVVDVAHDGVDGLHQAREGGYDAVVLDLMLPGLSGYQVCERLRAERNWVPVLILSAKDGEYDQADGLDLGADDYMTKPFSYVVLAARLRALLRRGARPRPAVLAAGDLSPRPGGPDRPPRRYRHRADRPGVRAARVPDAAGRPGGARRRNCSSTSGIPMRSATSTSSRSTRGMCDARSTPRSGKMPCRRCAGQATGSPPTAARDRARRKRAAVAGWWRRRSLRARLTLITSAGLAVALALAALLLASALRSALINGLDGSARQGAVEVATLLDQGRLPSPVPVPPDTVTVQVLDAAGRIVNVSPGADRLVPMLAPAQAREAARTGRARMLAGPPLGMPSLLRVVAVPARGQHVVIAAVSFAQVHDSLATLARALFIGTPLLFGLLALAIWLVTGYTLRPIAELRRGAAEVTGTGVPRDLPVPPARDEVRSLAVTLNDMLSRLADAQQRQRDLVSDTAHELRSPIASIRAQLEVALDHPDGLDWAETARDVHADTLRLARLAEDLLLLARLDGQHPAARPGRPGRAVRLGRGGLRHGPGPGAGPTSTEPCVVAGDPDALRRLLVNLLDNAVRHAASQVCVSVSAEAGWAVLTVTDDGPGIPASDRERVFGRFARLDNARDRTGEEGAGLGLAIVRSTAEAHGGSVSLSDAASGSAGPGLRAVVRLPLTS